MPTPTHFKIFFETDDGNIQCQFTRDSKGFLALGEMIFAAIDTRHAAYVMVTPDELEDLAEEDDNGNT